MDRILGIGVDIVEIARIEKAINEHWIDHVLTTAEKDTLAIKKGRKKIEFIAGRFAAKEAVMKAIGHDIPMTEIDIQNNEQGTPIARYRDYSLLLSISHERNQAIAFALYQGNL